jgi:hypothetical protein
VPALFDQDAAAGLGDRRIRLLALLLCLVLPAYSLSLKVYPRTSYRLPIHFTALKGLKTVASKAHLAEPVEVSDPIRANQISSSPWLICLKSGKSEESKRPTYSAYFTDKYVSSRYSSIVDHYGEQVYHPLKDN